MSGIVGIWNLDGRPLEEGLCSRLSATLAHRGPDGGGMWQQGPVGLACQLMRVTPESAQETQPLVHPLGAVLVFDGRLDNREELLGLLKASSEVDASSPDPALVLAAYYAFGERFVERLNGDFALGLFDPKRQQLIMARDAIGVRPLYYCQAGDTFLFASEIKAILAHPRVSPEPDDDLLADLLLYRISGDCQKLTLFKEVFRLLPGHIALLTPRGLVVRQYWDFDPERQIRLGSFEEYAEAYRHHFEQAVRRRLRSANPVAIFVSGGLDSSSIYCQAEVIRRQAEASHPPLIGLSYTALDGSRADENKFVCEIERAYGTAIKRLPLIPGLLDGCREAIRHIEAPYLDCAWNSHHSFFKAAKRLGSQSLLTGTWGDDFTYDQTYLMDLVQRFQWGQVWRHLNEFGRWFTNASPKFFWRSFLHDLIVTYAPETMEKLIRRWYRKLARFPDNRPWFTQALKERADRFAAHPAQTCFKENFATAQAKSLYKKCKSGIMTNALEWNNKIAGMHGLEMAFPFLDRDFLSFMVGIPGEMANWQGVPRGLMRRAMQGILPEAIARRNNKGDYTDFANAGMEQDLPQLVRYLQSGGAAIRQGYLDGKIINARLLGLKNRLRRDNCLLTWSLADLLGLELWLQIFFPDIAADRKKV